MTACSAGIVLRVLCLAHGLDGQYVTVTIRHLRLRLKTLGFPSLTTRLGTWQTITQTAPPPVLADALGIHPQTAIQHALRGSSQFGAYVAERGRHNDK